MKKTILCALTLMITLAGHAQDDFEAQASVTTPGGSAAVSPTERSEWLTPFEAVEIDAAADIRLVEAPATEAPRIVYDTRGDGSTRFRAEVRDGALRIRERSDAHRRERTAVTVYYNALRSLTVVDATVTFGNALRAPMFDLRVGARSNVEAEMEVGDLLMDLSGDSRATLTGKARYLTLTASTGQVEAAGLTCMSVVASAKNKAQVTVDATDRLDARISTDGSILYKQAPALLRTSQSLLAGSLGQIE